MPGSRCAHAGQPMRACEAYAGHRCAHAGHTRGSRCAQSGHTCWGSRCAHAGHTQMMCVHSLLAPASMWYAPRMCTSAAPRIL
eukprot:3445098-Pyramimonas_sp.AAC.1